MGILSVMHRVFGPAVEPTRFLVIGLDAAGKTTMLYKLKIGRVETTIPTIGFNVETVEYRTLHFTSWDVGGRDRIRPLWRHYYKQVCGLIFVVDSNDRDRVEDAREELQKTLNEQELKDVALLVFANKQDLSSAMTVPELTDKLGLSSLRDRQWYIQPSCAPSGEGLHEGLDWLHGAVARKRAGVKAATEGSAEEEEPEEQKAKGASTWSGVLATLKAVSSSSLMSSKFWLSLL